MLPLQEKGKNIKDFNFYNNADDMEKSTSVLETAYYFYEKEDVTVDDDRYWICGKEQQYYSSLLKRTKTLTRLTEVDFIINLISWSYIFLSHLFSCRITACKATSHC